MTKIQKSFSVLLIIIFLVIGVYVYNNSRTKEITSNTVSLTLDQVLNSNGFSNGKKGSNSVGMETILKDQAVLGDLDGDNINELAVPIESCGASCHLEVSVFKLDTNTNGIIQIQLPETFVSGAQASINSLQIKDSTLIVNRSGDIQDVQPITIKFKMSEGKIIKL